MKAPIHASEKIMHKTSQILRLSLEQAVAALCLKSRLANASTSHKVERPMAILR